MSVKGSMENVSFLLLPSGRKVRTDVEVQTFKIDPIRLLGGDCIARIIAPFLVFHANV